MRQRVFPPAPPGVAAKDAVSPPPGPRHLCSLLHENMCFNEAVFGSLAFYLSKRWPCAALLSWGDLWYCRHLVSICPQCSWCWLSPASGFLWCGGQELLRRTRWAGFGLYLGRKWLHFGCFPCKTLPHRLPQQAVVVRSVVFSFTRVRLRLKQV